MENRNRNLEKKGDPGNIKHADLGKKYGKKGRVARIFCAKIQESHKNYDVTKFCDAPSVSKQPGTQREQQNLQQHQKHQKQEI